GIGRGCWSGIGRGRRVGPGRCLYRWLPHGGEESKLSLVVADERVEIAHACFIEALLSCKAFERVVAAIGASQPKASLLKPAEGLGGGFNRGFGEGNRILEDAYILSGGGH